MKFFLLGCMFSILLIGTFNLSASAATEGIKMSEVNGGHSYTRVDGMMKSNAEGLNVLLYTRPLEFDSSGEMAVINLQSGNVLKTFKGVQSNIIMNDTATYYVYRSATEIESESELVYLDEFGNKTKLGLQGSPRDFFINSNVFIASSYSDVTAYDLDTHQEVFTNPVGTYNQILVGKDLAIVRDQSITILDATGNLKTILEFDDDIEEATFTQDCTKLIVSTKKSPITVFDTATYEKELVQFSGTENASTLVIDKLNAYMVFSDITGKFRLYNFKTGERIYTEKDDIRVSGDSLALSNNAKFILINDTVYSGQNIDTYIKTISLPKDLATIELGFSYKPRVLIHRANGKTDNVTQGVSWHPNNIDVAYMDTKNNELIASNLGEVTLLVKYLDFEIKKSLKVVDTKKPVLSGVENLSVYANTGAKALQDIKAIDIGEGDLTKAIKISGKFNVNVPGVYKLTYTVKDSSGNTATAKRTITVKYNPSKNMYLFSNGSNYSSKYLFNKDGTIRSTPTVASLVRTSYGELSSELGVEVKTTQKLTFKKLVIKSNGKTLTKSLTGSAYYSGSKNEYVIKKLTAADRKWIKNNIHANKKATVSVITKKKTINKTLTSKQAQGLLDGVLMYDYKKAQ